MSQSDSPGVLGVQSPHVAKFTIRRTEATPPLLFQIWSSWSTISIIIHTLLRENRGMLAIARTFD